MNSFNPSASSAISILEILREKVGSSLLTFMVSPNVILSLAGARGYCDVVFYNDSQVILEQWVREMQKVLKELGKITDVFFDDSQVGTTPGNDRYAGFDLVLTEGLSYSLHQTSFLTIDPKKILENKTSGEKVVDEITEAIKESPTFKDMNYEKQRDAGVGILLGYPDKAIEGSVTVWEDNDPFAESTIEADIRGAGYYSCPQPVYSYPRHLVTDEQITAHEKLWSNILTDYYHSDFHKTIEKNPEFIAKAKQLDLYP